MASQSAPKSEPHGMEIISTSKKHALPALFVAACRQPEVKKWDGSGQAHIGWDGLRRDHDLWLSEGDCLIYLYNKGESVRGPSFCIPYASVRAAGCDTTLFTGVHVNSSGRSSPYSSSNSSSDDKSPICRADKMELFLGAPGLERGQKFNWHITTRNFFAWLFGQPLVGQDLGLAFQQLFERLQLYRGPAIDNIQALLDYAQEIGYLDFVEHPEHALAMLTFAETHQIRDLYLEAFAHCVGMKDRLETCTGLQHISSLSKALITRAHLEMDLHIERATISIGSFMEEELSAVQLGLSRGARAHLDTFRSFLHTYCVAKYGYWPPSCDSTYSRTLYQSMHKDVQALYDYLADKEAINDATGSQSAAGSLCLLQDIEVFNNEHQYQALPHSLPLCPSISASDDASYGQRNRRTAWLGFNNNHQNDPQRSEAVRDALSLATNRGDTATMSCLLVQAYGRFENEQANARDGDVSVTDARKVRWLLIYAMLQTLSSVTHAPAEVRMAAVTPYPLCCLTTGTPPWKSSTTMERMSKSFTTSSDDSSLNGPSTPEPVTRSDHDYFHGRPNDRPGHIRLMSSPSSISIRSTPNHRQVSTSSSKRFPNFLRRSSMRDSSAGSSMPPPIPIRRRESRPSIGVTTQAACARQNENPSNVRWIGSATYSPASAVPELDWSPDMHDKADTRSEDDNSSPDLDQSRQFVDMHPSDSNLVTSEWKSDQIQLETRIRNSLDAILDNLLESNGLLQGVAL